jgi:hypothetical protein
MKKLRDILAEEGMTLSQDDRKRSSGSPPANDDHATAGPVAKPSRPDNDLWRRIEAKAENDAELRKRLRGYFTNPDDRSLVAMDLGGALIRAGLSYDEMDQALHECALTAAWAYEKGDLDDKREIRRIFERAYKARTDSALTDLAHVRPLQDIPGAQPAVADPTRKRRMMTLTPRRELKNRPKRLWHYNSYIPERGKVVLVGHPGHGKTFGSTSLCVDMALGEDWADIPFGSGEGPGPVAVWLGEGLDDADQRITAYENYHGYDEVEFLDVWTGPFIADEISEKYRGKKLRMLGIDTLSKLFGSLGLDENSSKDAAVLMDMLDRLREELGCVILILHHLGKDETRGARGSTVILGDADAVFLCTAKLAGQIVWSCTKMRSAEAPPPLIFDLKKFGDSAVLVKSIAPLPVGAGVPKGNLETLAVETLECAIADREQRNGRAPRAGLPLDVNWGARGPTPVPIIEWRQYFLQRYVGTKNMGLQAFKRVRKSLQEKGIIYVTADSHVQLASGVV